jgi:hypothetical protein
LFLVIILSQYVVITRTRLAIHFTALTVGEASAIDLSTSMLGILYKKLRYCGRYTISKGLGVRLIFPFSLKPHVPAYGVNFDTQTKCELENEITMKALENLTTANLFVAKLNFFGSEMKLCQKN